MGILSSKDFAANQQNLHLWLEKFQGALVLTPDSVSQLTVAKAKPLSTLGGRFLQVRKISPEMLRKDQTLAFEVHSLAKQGLLGFVSPTMGNSTKVQFHKDMADKLKNIKIQVILEPPLTSSSLTSSSDVSDFSADLGQKENFEVEDIDINLYATMAGVLVDEIQIKSTEQEVEEKNDQAKMNKQEKNLQQSMNPLNQTISLRKGKSAASEILGLENQRTLVQNQIKHSREAREAEKKRIRQHQDLEDKKREIVNTEIKKTEIVKTERREDLNQGESVKR